MLLDAAVESNAVRISFLIAVLIGLAPAASLGCTCNGTQSIGNALTSADVVIVGKVRSHQDAEYSSEHPVPAIVSVEVIESFRGEIKGSVEIAKSIMCYQSFPEDDLQIGRSYVLPLEQIDLANAGSVGLVPGSKPPVPGHSMFRLPLCSHNALLVDGEGLYTSEVTSSGGRRLEYYMSLPLLKALLPVGLLSVWGRVALAAVAAALVAAFVRIRRRRRKSRLIEAGR